MTCKEFIDFLMAYLDGELEGDVAKVFEEHMHLCPPCVEYLESYKATVALGRQACCDETEVPPEVPEGLIKAIQAARREQS